MHGALNGTLSIRSEEPSDEGCTPQCRHCHMVRCLQERVLNVRLQIPEQRTVFVWKLKNYAYHKNIGERVYSPEFYTGMKGHCCQLKLRWNEDKSIGVFIMTKT